MKTLKVDDIQKQRMIEGLERTCKRIREIIEVNQKAGKDTTGWDLDLGRNEHKLAALRRSL